MAIFKSLNLNPKIIIASTLVLAIIILIVIQFLNGSKSPATDLQPVFSPQSSLTTDHFPLPSSSPVKDLQGKGSLNYSQEINQDLAVNYPLKDFLPYKNSQFSLKYLAPLTLQAEAFSSTPSAQTQIESWIKSKGIDPATHKIFYQ